MAKGVVEAAVADQLGPGSQSDEQQVGSEAVSGQRLPFPEAEDEDGEGRDDVHGRDVREQRGRGSRPATDQQVTRHGDSPGERQGIPIKGLFPVAVIPDRDENGPDEGDGSTDDETRSNSLPEDEPCAQAHEDGIGGDEES